MPVVIEVVMAVSDLTRDAAAEEKRIDREVYECVDEPDHGDAEVVWYSEVIGTLGSLCLSPLP